MELVGCGGCVFDVGFLKAVEEENLLVERVDRLQMLMVPMARNCNCCCRYCRCSLMIVVALLV